MERISFDERNDWQADADAIGFTFHSMYGDRYWDERHAYQFTLAQIENDLESVTAELTDLCYQAVDHIVADRALMRRMAIPEAFHTAVSESWHRQDRDLYGRFDLSYDGNSPAKMLEFNADTPTSLLESAVFQWRWLEDMMRNGKLPAEADQFNSVHERLLDALPVVAGKGSSIHFAAVTGNEEDFGCVQYLADCAIQAGLEARLIDISHIGIDAEGWFTDTADMRIETLFKLYPLEDMVREEFGIHLRSTATRIVEPLWKLALSTKAMLPVLWEMFPNHPNLLETYFENDPRAAKLGASYVRKPFLSREGANVTIIAPEVTGGRIGVEGPYGSEGYIRQQLHLLPQFGEDWTVIGSWIVAGQPAGIGLREDHTPITRDTSRFVPHYILD